MRNVHRLHLLGLLLTTLCVVLSTLLLFAPSKPVHPHQKQSSLDSNLVLVLSICASHSAGQIAFGGDGGNRTPVQNTFLIASYSNIFHQCINIFMLFSYKNLWLSIFNCDCNHNLIYWQSSSFFEHFSICCTLHKIV